jgi:hypothetical protein
MVSKPPMLSVLAADVINPLHLTEFWIAIFLLQYLDAVLTCINFRFLSSPLAGHGYPTNMDYWNAQPGTLPTILGGR